jgi:alpha,alpha-trehalose phosphorylase
VTSLEKTRYGSDPFALRVRGVDSGRAGQEESLFALSNGWLGVRGVWEQGRPLYEPGVLVNGFHETWPITYPEGAFGYATAGQTIVYLPDPSGLRVSVDGRLLDLVDGEVDRTLDFSTGVLETNARWPEVSVRWRKLVSLVYPNLVAATIEVTAHASVAVSVESGWDRHISRGAAGFDPRKAAASHNEAVIEDPVARIEGALGFSVTYRTPGSAMALDCECRHRADPGLQVEANGTQTVFRADLVAQQTIAIEKRTIYGNADTAGTALSFADLEVAQSAHLDRFWAQHRITIDSDPVLQQAINWIVFELHQASVLVDAGGVPAKGLSGQAYEGHVFWDMDVFMLPFVAHTDPTAAARLLRYRYSMLPEARIRAGQLNLKGALFPWRTITGEEASAYYEAGTAQYHIDAAVIFGMAAYFDATGDRNLLWEIGVEMAVETARMWADLGFFGSDGRFHIHMVTGPDEYTALVDDNTYTNLMARFNLERTVDWLASMNEEAAHLYRELVARLGVDDREVEEWRRAADAMYVGFDEDLGIHAQDARFLEREPWDWDTPRDQYPLLLHFHPLVIYRHQVLKQADVVMAIFNLPDQFTPEVARADFDFYDPITTGDSSLSSPVQAGVAAMVGRLDRAVTLMRRGALTDLDDLAGNTDHGLHLAAAGGVWLALVKGFGGFRRNEGMVVIDPRVPREWGSLSFSVLVDGSPLTIRAAAEALTLVRPDGEPLVAEVFGQKVTVAAQPVTINRP